VILFTLAFIGTTLQYLGRHLTAQIRIAFNGIITVDFIVVGEPINYIPQAVHHHRVLLENFLAQAQVLSHGKASEIPNENYLDR
jgi:glucose-6-phosphate isomerase